MTLDIAALRALIAAATPGPWTHDPEGNMGAGSVYTSHEDLFGGNIAEPAGDLYPRGGYDPKADMVLIAASRAALPAALDEIERLQAERVALRRRLKAIVGLNAHYRIGSTPSEKLLAELDASRDALAQYDTEGEHRA